MANTMFTISDDESEVTEEIGDTDQSNTRTGVMSSEDTYAQTAPLRVQGDQPGRVRLRSESQVYAISEGEFQEQEAGEGCATEEGTFRRRTRSAPPALWAAKKYGQQLRRMSDEFDSLLGKGMKRVQSEEATRTMHPSRSWFAFLWSHQETDAEMGSSSLTASDARPSE